MIRVRGSGLVIINCVMNLKCTRSYMRRKGKAWGVLGAHAWIYLMGFIAGLIAYKGMIS